MTRGFNIDGRGVPSLGRGGEIGAPSATGGFSTGFETAADWEVAGSGVIVSSNQRSGNNAAEFGGGANNDAEGQVAYNPSENDAPLFAEANIYAKMANGSYYNFGMHFRRPDGGGTHLAVVIDGTAGSGTMYLYEGTLGSWTQLASAGSFGTFSTSYNEYYFALKDGGGGDVIAEVEAPVGSTRYSTPAVSTSVTNGGGVGFGRANVSNSGGPDYIDDETVTYL